MRSSSILKGLLLAILSFPVIAENEGYMGYLLGQKGDPESAVYKTANTDTASAFVLPDDPDVYLNATVNVDSIRVDVANLIAKVDLDAKVLDLLHFSAGVDASIDRVSLRIDDVYARAELEARLGNVVRMVDDVLRSVDLNPLVAAVGKNLGKVVGATGDLVGGTAQGILGGGEKPGGTSARPAAGGGDGAGEARPPRTGSSGQDSPAGGDASGQQNIPPEGGGGSGQDTPRQGGAAGPQSAPQQGAGGGSSQQNTPPQRGEPERKNPSYGAPHGVSRPLHPVEAGHPNILWFFPNPATGGAAYDDLAQNGDILKVTCDAQGNTLTSIVAGPYNRFMEYTGGSWSVQNAWGQWEKMYQYKNGKGPTRVCYIYMNEAGQVVRTSVDPFDWSQIQPGQE